MKKTFIIKGIAAIGLAVAVWKMWPRNEVAGDQANLRSAKLPAPVSGLPQKSAESIVEKKRRMPQNNARRTETILADIENLKLKTKWTDADYGVFKELLLELASQDPEAACGMLSKGLGYKVYEHKVGMFSIMIENFDAARLGPMFDQMAKSLGSNPEGYETATALAVAFAKLGNTADYDVVIRTLFSGDKAASLISTYFNEATLANGVASLEAIEKFGLTDRQKSEASLAVAFALSTKDHETSFKMLEGLDPNFVGSAYGRLISQWLLTDRKRAESVFQGFDATKLQSVLRDPDMLGLMNDPENRKMLEGAIQKLPLNNANHDIFKTLAGDLFKADREYAVEILNDLPESAIRSDLIKELWSKSEISGSDEARALISKLPAESRLDASRGILEMLGKTNTAEATKFIYNSPPETQSALMQQMISQVSQRSPTEAVSIFTEQYNSGRLKEAEGAAILGDITLTYANLNLADARKWASKLPASAQPEAFSGLMKSWSRSDPVAASEWLTQFPPGPSRDAGARALAEEIKSSDPKTAEQWLQTIKP